MRACRRCGQHTIPDALTYERYCHRCHTLDRGTWALLIRAKLHSIVARIRQWWS